MSEQRWVIYVDVDTGDVPFNYDKLRFGREHYRTVEVVPASLLEERDRQLASSNEHNTAFLQAIVEHEEEKEVLRSQLTEARAALEDLLPFAGVTGCLHSTFHDDGECDCDHSHDPSHLARERAERALGSHERTIASSASPGARGAQEPETEER